MKTKFIGHIDADCFYVSCERIRDFRLKDKPVAVLGNQGACVIARSYETRPFGITVGMPIWKARQLCPDGIYIKRDFEWYDIISKQMQKLLHRFSDTVEYYSVDESFVDFGDFKGNLKNLAEEIQNKILEEIGLPVSVGIAPTRTLAKIGSEKHKPFGITIIKEENIREFLKTCVVEEIPGIGRKLSKRISYLETALDYIKEPQQKIRKQLHKPGEEIWYELQGISLLPIRAKRPERKVISRGGSLWGNHKDYFYVWGFLVRNLERLATQLIKENIETCSITVLLITTEDFILKNTQNFPDYTNANSALLAGLKRAFEKVFQPIYAYSHVHIIASPLRSNSQKQLNIFSGEDKKEKDLAVLKQKINAKYGQFAVRSGATAYVPKVFEDETSNYEICDIDGKICF